MPPAPIDPAPRRAFRRQVLLLSAGHLLAFVDRTKVVGLLPTIRRQVPMSDTAAGWVLGTAFALGYALSIALVTAMARRRRGRDHSHSRLCAGIALWGLASLATGLSTSVGALIAARLLVGAGQALFIPAAVSRLTADGEAVGLGVGGLSRFTAAASIGRSAGLFAVAVALAVIGALGATPAFAWRWVFALTALPNLALFLLLWRRRGRTAEPPAAVPIRGDRATRVLYMLLVLLPFILTQALGGWLPTLFARDRGVGTGASATWVGVIVLVAGTSSQLVAGWLLQRTRLWQRRVPVVVAGALIAAAPAIALTGWGPGAAAATLGAFLASLILGGATFAALVGWQRLIPEADRLAANGIFFALITVVGTGVGPLLTGVLTDRGLTLREALLAMTAVFAVAAALLAALAQPRYRRHAAA